MRIYVASSWRNSHQPSVVNVLRARGHDVYDFRNPAPGNHGFGWSQIDPAWQTWTTEQFRDALHHPIAREGLRLDEQALAGAECTVLVLPCGRSAHLELGYAIGIGQLTYVYAPVPQEPELMYGMADGIAANLGELLVMLHRTPTRANPLGT